jgi:hypothetical protein
LGPRNHCELSIDEHIGIGQIMIVKPRKVVRWIVMSPFGNPWSTRVLMYHQYERKDTCRRSSTLGVITQGEREFGEVEPPEP